MPEEAQIPEFPTPDLEVVEEMQMGIVTGLAEIQHHKAAGTPVAWCSVLTPKEILNAMDVPCVYGNVLGAYASIFGMSAKYCQVAEDNGLSRDVCSVNRCQVGVALCDDREPFFENAFVEPDIAIGSNFPCTSESKAFLHVARKFGAPYYVIDTPINTWGKEIPEHAIEYCAGELQGMISFLEEHGFTFSMDRLKQEVAFSKRLNSVIQEIDDLKSAIPMPMRAFDTVIAMTAPLALAKEARKIELFERLRDEIEERVKRGHGVVENERLRLLWIGLPPLFDFPFLNYPENHGAVIPKTMLEFLVGFTLDPDLMDPERPLESIARAQLASPANPSYSAAIDYFVRAAVSYRVDGIVCAVMRSCGMVPGMQRITKESIQEKMGVPAMIVDLDGADQRDYDPPALKAQLDSFIETLLARKGG